MKKEAKLVLIVGILGLFISVLYLFVINKSPTDPEQNVLEDLTNSGENVLSGNLSEGLTGNLSLTGDENLFGNVDPNLQEDQTPNARGQAQNIFQDTGLQSDSSENTGKYISVMIPAWFYNDGFEQLAMQIYQQTGIFVKYEKVESLSDYKKYLLQDTGDSIDVFLLPSDWVRDFSGKKVNFGEDIAVYFHPIFSEFINQNSYTFLPYSLDLLVTFVNKNSAYKQDNIDFQKIFAYVISWKKTKTFAIPFLFGVDENDVKLLEKNQESYPDYFTFWYNLFYQLKKSKNNLGLKTFFDTINFNSDYKRDLFEFKKLTINISKTRPDCKTYPNICAFSYRFSDMIFGFVSDQILINNFTGGGIGLDNTLIYNFPISTDDYKVRGRGFVVSQNSKNNSQTDYFLKTYIKLSVLNSLPLWENNLSAFNNIFQIQKIQKRYENILKYEPNFSLMFSDINLQENFIKKTNLSDTLLGDYDLDLFLNNLTRER